MFKIEGLAPNSSSSSEKALSFVKELNRVKKVADIGCGSGIQSIIISSEIKEAEIMAIDHRYK